MAGEENRWLLKKANLVHEVFDLQVVAAGRCIRDGPRALFSDVEILGNRNDSMNKVKGPHKRGVEILANDNESKIPEPSSQKLCLVRYLETNECGLRIDSTAFLSTAHLGVQHPN